MKKYCVTQCARDKMSAGMENVVATIAIILGVVALTLAGAIFFFILGAIIQFTMLGLFGINNFEYNPILLSMGYSLLVFVTGSVLYIACQFLAWIWKGVFYVSKNITMNIIAPERASCRLFEECK